MSEDPDCSGEVPDSDSSGDDEVEAELDEEAMAQFDEHLVAMFQEMKREKAAKRGSLVSCRFFPTDCYHRIGTVHRAHKVQGPGLVGDIY